MRNEELGIVVEILRISKHSNPGGICTAILHS